jgi:hypothetical protein
VFHQPDVGSVPVPDNVDFGEGLLLIVAHVAAVLVLQPVLFFGTQVNLKELGKVPSARSADTATNAGHARSADTTLEPFECSMPALLLSAQSVGWLRDNAPP